MIDGDDIKVLEYNARFGDPETQSILPLLKTDLFEIFLAVSEKRLDCVKIEWNDKSAVCVVMASGGYPQNYKKGEVIEIGQLDDNVTVFHAGTKLLEGKLVTDGGRVLGVTAIADSMEQARVLAYDNIERIIFNNAHYRKDIGIK